MATTFKNADIVINKGGVLYRTYSFKPARQEELAQALVDIAALQGGSSTDGGRIDALEVAINGNGNDVAGIEARLTAQETAWSTFFEGETDNSKIDTLKEILGEINSNTSSISDLLTAKANKADVVDSTEVADGGSLSGKIASATLAKSIEDSVDALEQKVDDMVQVVNALPTVTTTGVTYVVVDDDDESAGE